MGTIFVDNLEPQSGTSLTLGASGDTVGLASGASQTFAVNTPAFLAYGNTGQTASTDTDTVVSLNLEIFDSDGKYDTSTYKFTPTVAGKYFLFGQARLNTDHNFNEFQVNIIKNGSTGLARAGGVYGHYDIFATSVIADLDADDYVQLTVYQASGSNKDITDNQNLTFFGGYKVIGA
jgi:hypothetical protein